MTHRSLSFLLAPALLAAAATSAAAQPSTEPAAAAPAPAAPQTHEWNDVSHINGELVPVGESNSYVKKYKRTNIAINPLGLMVGFYGISASYGLNDHVAIRGDMNYYSPVDSDSTGTEFGVGVPIYLRRTYQGAFIEPGFISRHTQSPDDFAGDQYDSSHETSTVGPQVLVGWHATWDSGLNIAAAVGVGRNLADGQTYADSTYDDSDDAEPFMNGYFRVGYAF